MKSKSYNIEILCFFILFLVFTSCSKSQNYYPLEKGYRWEYDTFLKGPISLINNHFSIVMLNNGIRNVYGKDYFEQEMIVKGRSICFLYKNDQYDGLKRYGKYNPKESLVRQSHVIFATPIFIIKNPLNVGTTWTEEIETSLVREKFKLDVKCRIVSLDENVSVPAGNFKNVLKILKYGTATKNLGVLLGRAEISVIIEEWYALDVGLVKSLTIEKSKQSWIRSGEALITLYSYSK